MKIAKLYVRTLMHSALVLLMACFTFASCSKDKSVAPPPAQEEDIPTIFGVWNGEYGIGTPPNKPYKFNIKQGNILELLDDNKAVTAKGTWQLNGDVFTGHYTFLQGAQTTISMMGKIDAQFRHITNGTWGYDSQAKNGGKWYLNKADE